MKQITLNNYMKSPFTFYNGFKVYGVIALLFSGYPIGNPKCDKLPITLFPSFQDYSLSAN
jgi:hypothetical protein